jgi:hypothetical protein
MSLNLKIEEESTVENTETDQTTVETTVETTVTEETNTTNDTVVEVLDLAARREARIARFNANALKKEEALKEAALKLKLKLLSEDEKNKFLAEKTKFDKITQLELQKEMIRNKRSAIVEAEKIEKERQIIAGEAYRQKLEAERIAREESIRIQKEAEERAAEALREAEEARRIADEINAEAERFAEEARRRVEAAEIQAKETAKKINKVTTKKI